jgi:hypothetical protein
MTCFYLLLLFLTADSALQMPCADRLVVPLLLALVLLLLHVLLLLLLLLVHAIVMQVGCSVETPTAK